ncbi:MAG TPA: methyltransferase domain-containing protein [Opitutaceae bacterium]|nr:methyltransferase domain-containing protein [Opitutaceae bacterium]
MPPRVLQPELLDSLAPEHPDALHSRRDLRLINQIMGNHRWLTRTIAPLLRPGERTLELGAGTGEFGQRMAAQGIAVDGLDLCPRPSSWAPGRAWHIGDLRTFEGYDRYPVVFGNLVFHHFNDTDLAVLGGTLRRCRDLRVIAACEPMRRRKSQTAFAAAGRLLGANPVTLHDAHVSIAAGFLDDELPRTLGLDPAVWDCRCRTTVLGAYRMVAVRRA